MNHPNELDKDNPHFTERETGGKDQLNDLHEVRVSEAKPQLKRRSSWLSFPIHSPNLSSAVSPNR